MSTVALVIAKAVEAAERAAWKRGFALGLEIGMAQKPEPSSRCPKCGGKLRWAALPQSCGCRACECEGCRAALVDECFTCGYVL